MADSPVYLSIVIPAYNEERRLPAFLDAIARWAEARPYACEVVVVDDGSRDGTAAVVESYARRHRMIRLSPNQANRGKGFSVKKGLLEARGRVAVFMDADGSVQPEEIDRNLPLILEEGYDIVIGSRAIEDASCTLVVRRYRRFVGIVFNFCVHSFLFRDIQDTQCGFKMFRKDVIVPLCSRVHLDGFGFDIELLYLAHKMGYRIKERAVSWHHVPDSKINLVTDSARMFANILQVRLWHCTPVSPHAGMLGPDEYRYMYALEKRHWWFVGKRRLAVELIRLRRQPAPAILDAGCGTGGNLIAFDALGPARGVDMSEQAVAFCRKNGLDRVSRRPVSDTGFPDRMFDIVTCLDLLEHLPEPSRDLAEIHRVLKDDGALMVTVPAFNWLWSNHDEALGHLRRYTPVSLARDLAEAGFAIRQSGYLFFTSFFLVAPFRVLRRLFPRREAVSDTTTLPPRWINALMIGILKIEVALRAWLPFGTTLWAMAEKTDANNRQ